MELIAIGPLLIGLWLMERELIASTPIWIAAMALTSIGVIYLAHDRIERNYG